MNELVNPSVFIWKGAIITMDTLVKRYRMVNKPSCDVCSYHNHCNSYSIHECL